MTYPGWRTNIIIFTGLIAIVGSYFYIQTRQASLEFSKHSQQHSEVLAAVVELNIRNALLSRSGLEDVVAHSLINSSRFIHSLNAIEPFASAELTAFAGKSGLAGVKVISGRTGVASVSGPPGWLPGESCPDSAGLERIDDGQLYLYSFFAEIKNDAEIEQDEEYEDKQEQSCVQVALAADKIDDIIKKISVERLLTMFNDLHDIAYVRLVDSNKQRNEQTVDQAGVAVTETIISMGSQQLIVALKTDRLGKRREQIYMEFILFISLLIFYGALSSWWLYRIQCHGLQQTATFERKLARQHEDAALGRAAATITHELRNPLNAIGMGLQRLQIESQSLEQDQQELIVSMRDSLGRTNAIITRLKQYSDSFTVDAQPVNVSNLLSTIITLYDEQCIEQEVVIEFDKQQDVSIAGDKVLLGQLFENILKNSIEAQPKGGFVRISIGQDRDNCLIEIVNNGFMLTSEESRLLFEPYFTSKSKGTGLGLVISKKIVDAHHGSLDWFVDPVREEDEQILGRKIHFQISLPVAGCGRLI